MIKPTKVLIVEEEPLIAHSIKEALNQITKSTSGSTYTIKYVSDYELAYSEIEASKCFNLVFLNIDVSCPAFEKFKYIKNMTSTLKLYSPKAQLLTLTSVKDNYMIVNMIKTLNPEGVLFKKEITFEDLVTAIENVVNNTPFYSKTILKLLRSCMTCNISLDKRDRLILYHLSRGIKTKDLPKLVHLSIGGIESRKRNLKTLFNVEHKSDQFLLEQARLKGII